MYGAITKNRPAFCGLTQVHELSEIEHLVKESEVLTRAPGRKFIVQAVGQDKLSYRILCYPTGYRVHRLDGADQPTCTIDMLQEDLLQHALGMALREGRLFTPAI